MLRGRENNMSADVKAAQAAIVGIVRNLEFALEDGRIVLKGQCRSFYGKKLAQDTVRACLPNTAIVNRIKVHESVTPALTS